MAESSHFIPVAKPWLGERELDALRRPILSGWVTQGPEVAAFEQEFAAYVGAAHACAVSSCTVALHLALLTVGVEPGDEVITPSHSFVATANAIRYCGATPVFVDIDPGTYNLDPSRVAEVVTARTRAVLCVHQIGMPCDLRAILDVARRHDIRVVEDAACAVGSEFCSDGRWERVGKPHGDVACFSFHPRKVLTTGDGGMLTTSNAEWDRQFRLARQHGMNVPDAVRHQSRQVVFESYPQLGYNYRMTDIQAAIGRVQLERMPEVIARRRELAARYDALLTDAAGPSRPAEPTWARSNYQSYCVRLPVRCDQRAVMQTLLDQGIATRRGVMCAHREAAYPRGTWRCGGEATCGCRANACERLAESERAQDHCIILPLYHEMTVADQEAVVAALYAALD